MEWSKTGCLLVPTKKYNDDRGYFTEIYKASKIEAMFKQDNLSYSYENVVRGMHFQYPLQGKLVRCIRGMVTDVVIDMRKESVTFGMMETFQLIAHAADDLMVFIPPGFAHGFMAQAESILLYKCTEEYNPKSETGITPLDPSFDFPWKGMRDLIISDKDKALPTFEEFKFHQFLA